MLKERYKHVKKGTEQMKPNAFHLYFKTDNKPKNGGRCFYNYNVDTYYVGVRKWKDTVDKIQLEIERNNVKSGHTMITFYISGKHKQKCQNIKTKTKNQHPRETKQKTKSPHVRTTRRNLT